MLRTRILLVSLVWLTASAGFLQAADPVGPVAGLHPVAHRLTAEDIGYGQGVFLNDGKIYLYGDGETGIIREFNWSAETPHSLQPTGKVIKLTRNGEDIAPHPTGLTHHPEIGTFLGDTVNQTGVIYHIDWKLAVKDGNLDQAVKNMVVDDLAFNGTRPEFVKIGERWLIATADYGEEGNELRLYDPERLKVVSRASSAGVLVHKQPCGPFVQTVEWVPELETLALVQNQIAGLRYRLTFAVWDDDDLTADFSQPFDLAEPRDELEGWGYLGNGWSLYLSSSPRVNVSLGRLKMAE